MVSHAHDLTDFCSPYVVQAQALEMAGADEAELAQELQEKRKRDLQLARGKKSRGEWGVGGSGGLFNLLTRGALKRKGGGEGKLFDFRRSPIFGEPFSQWGLENG